AAFTDGSSHLNTLRYDEVGIIELAARLAGTTYLGLDATESAKITGRSAHVGRFGADYFATRVVHHGCSDADGMSYSRQPLRELRVEARNVAGDVVANYSWDALAGSGYARDVSLSDVVAASPGAFINGAIGKEDFGAGVAVSDDVAFAFSSTRLPYALTVRATDSDSASSAGHVEGTTQVRAARLALDRAFAPDFLPANAVLRVESWRALSATTQAWDHEPQDACTSLALAAVTLDEHAGAVGAVAPLSLTLAQGIGRLVLSPAGSGNHGSLRALLDVPGWLEYAWGGGAAEDPAATMSWSAIHREPQGFISRQEVH